MAPQRSGAETSALLVSPLRGVVLSSSSSYALNLLISSYSTIYHQAYLP